jgi:hypothetical protein
MTMPLPTKQKAGQADEVDAATLEFSEGIAELVS